MTTITLPDGTFIIDDSELNPDFEARRMAHEGSTAVEIAEALEVPLEDVQRWLEVPYESPEAYWLRRYHAGTHLDDEE
ncbi:hypothetical protein FHW75_004656 [Pseudomonas sp. OG7]|uniref:hypothetical protein n=1 Tax=Pseudomonas sp. OG7 TaxID=2587037 RepID=UPI00161CFD62|nr:hypothetical protein [Pseudomonas sp. OG7]MBB3273445.1 hypothetical protein [Pseudomonas sp. OG7]